MTNVTRKGNVNPLTLQPGGKTLKLVFNEGKVQVQPRIKSAQKYIDKILKDCEGSESVLKVVYDITDRDQQEVIWKA